MSLRSNFNKTKSQKSKFLCIFLSKFFRGGDILCEMRFYVPNMVENSENEDKPMKENGAEENEEEEITPAKIMNDQILKKAGLGDSAGDIICSFHDLPLLVPRGKYTLEMFENYAKFHGRTHDYKILYKDIL